MVGVDGSADFAEVGFVRDLQPAQTLAGPIAAPTLPVVFLAEKTGPEALLAVSHVLRQTLLVLKQHRKQRFLLEHFLPNFQDVAQQLGSLVRTYPHVLF